MNSNEKMKVAAMFSAISSRDSCFIETRARSGAGKTTEDEKCLSCFNKEEDVVYVNNITEAALFKHDDEKYFDKKIIVLGDIGNEQFSRLRPALNIFKSLVTEKRYLRELKKQKQLLVAESLCCVYTTTKKTVKDYQIISRSLQFSLNHTVIDEDVILQSIVDNVDLEFDRDDDVDFYRKRISKIKCLDIDVVNPFRQDMLELIRDEKLTSLKRKLKQLYSLFDSYVLLNTDDKLENGVKVTASKELFDEFMQHVFNCSLFEENVEKDFYNMFAVDCSEQYKLEKIDIYDFVAAETEGRSLDDFSSVQREELFNMFFKKYMLLSRSKHNTSRNVFFTLKNIRDVYRCSNAFKNVDDLSKCLLKLQKWGLICKCSKYQGNDVYYLCSD